MVLTVRLYTALCFAVMSVTCDAECKTKQKLYFTHFRNQRKFTVVPPLFGGRQMMIGYCLISVERGCSVIGSEIGGRKVAFGAVGGAERCFHRNRPDTQESRRYSALHGEMDRQENRDVTEVSEKLET